MKLGIERWVKGSNQFHVWVYTSLPDLVSGFLILSSEWDDVRRVLYDLLKGEVK